MKGIILCAPKKHSDLALEWDRLAEERHRQIAAGEDPSFEYVLAPTALRLLEGADLVATRVVGIEPSRVSVAVAKTNCVDLTNVQFVETRVEDARNLLPPEPVTGAVASMTMMTTPDLSEFARALATLLRRGAKFVATLCHPSFWPRYWGYESEPWFNYAKEIFIEAPFVISKHQTDVRTTHIHRPLERYVAVFADAGFELEALVEPMPSSAIQKLYPQPWRFPRFLGLRWVKRT